MPRQPKRERTPSLQKQLQDIESKRTPSPQKRYNTRSQKNLPPSQLPIISLQKELQKPEPQQILPEAPLRMPVAQGQPDFYNNFLQQYIVGNQNRQINHGENGESEKIIPQAEVNQWPYPYDHNSDQSKIIQEIINKFVNHNKFGIGKIFNTDEPGALAAYSFEGDMEYPQSNEDYTYFSIPIKTTHAYSTKSKKNAPLLKNYRPDPMTIAHEMVHANDHQIDYMSPRIWEYLGNLYNQTPNELGPKEKNFEQSIQRIANKIDPVIFGNSSEYTPQTVKDKITDEINQYRWENVPGKGSGPEHFGIEDASNKSFLELNAKEREKLPKYSWQEALPRMMDITNYQTKRPGINEPITNYHFKGTHASEFPAFMSENLTRSWDTGDKKGNQESPRGAEALTVPEARFLHSSLNEMARAYPARDAQGQDLYPTMNRHIRDRSNSIEGAYGRNELLNNQDNEEKKEEFRSGGHVMKFRARNGLSRYPRKSLANFIKTGRV